MVKEDYLDKDKVSIGTNVFTYNGSGDVIKKLYKYNNEYYVLDGDEINSIEIKKDKSGNVVFQEFKRKSIDGFYTEECTYEYYSK